MRPTRKSHAIELILFMWCYARWHHWTCGYTQLEAATINHAPVTTFMFGWPGTQIDDHYIDDLHWRFTLTIYIDDLRHYIDDHYSMLSGHKAIIFLKQKFIIFEFRIRRATHFFHLYGNGSIGAKRQLITAADIDLRII